MQTQPARTAQEGLPAAIQTLALVPEDSRFLANRRGVIGRWFCPWWFGERVGLISPFQSRSLVRHVDNSSTLQAAIPAVHAESSSADCTDWRQIMLLYDRLMRIQLSPVVELNRAVAIAMYKGPEKGLRLIDDLLAREDLANYSLAHSARADLCRRLGRVTEAQVSYEKALALIPDGAQQDPEHRFLRGRLEELKAK
jgi:predicted RNA polymerase sigma factor